MHNYIKFQFAKLSGGFCRPKQNTFFPLLFNQYKKLKILIGLILPNIKVNNYMKFNPPLGTKRSWIPRQRTHFIKKKTHILWNLPNISTKLEKSPLTMCFCYKPIWKSHFSHLLILKIVPDLLLVLIFIVYVCSNSSVDSAPLGIKRRYPKWSITTSFGRLWHTRGPCQKK